MTAATITSLGKCRPSATRSIATLVPTTPVTIHGQTFSAWRRRIVIAAAAKAAKTGEEEEEE
jgi:hypothetical protein